jgi:two-component system response regulator FixJ
MSSEVAVHVIDDDEAVRDSLAFLFQSAALPVRTYPSPVPFLDVADGLGNGCVVTDVRMPEMNGLDLVRELKSRGLDLPIIVMTGHGDVPMAVEAMKEGAADFLEKPFDDEVLLGAVRRALSRPPVAGPGGGEAAEVRARVDQLSVRERQVLSGLLEGLPNKTIAYDLGISARTVEIYRAKVMTKMEASSFAELVRLAITAGVK